MPKAKAFEPCNKRNTTRGERTERNPSIVASAEWGEGPGRQQNSHQGRRGKRKPRAGPGAPKKGGRAQLIPLIVTASTSSASLDMSSRRWPNGVGHGPRSPRGMPLPVSTRAFLPFLATYSYPRLSPPEMPAIPAHPLPNPVPFQLTPAPRAQCLRMPKVLESSESFNPPVPTSVAELTPKQVSCCLLTDQAPAYANVSRFPGWGPVCCPDSTQLPCGEAPVYGDLLTREDPLLVLSRGKTLPGCLRASSFGQDAR